MAALPPMEAFPEKNTFIHFDEPSSLALPPANSAPGTLLDRSFRMKDGVPEEAAVLKQPATGCRQSFFRRMFGSHRETEEMPAQPGVASPMEIQLKNTFVHFEDPRTPAGPPVSSAPSKTVFLSAPLVSDGSRSGLISVMSSVASKPSTGLGDQVVVAHAPLNRERVQGPPSMAIEDTVQLSNVETCKRAGLASLGSEGHCSGKCIPCLMQVRWQAGKSAEPCKFGALCGRCHEAHTEEELQKIQAKMRRLKRRHGEKAAALLSSAYAKGNVAPVGTGAAAAQQAE